MSRGGKKGEGNGDCGCKSPLNPCSQWGLFLGERSENRTKLRGAEAWDYSLELIGERIFLPSLQPSYPFLPGQSGWPASSCSDPLTSTLFSCFECFWSLPQTWNGDTYEKELVPLSELGRQWAPDGAAVHGYPVCTLHLAITTEGFQSYHGWLTCESTSVMQSVWASEKSPTSQKEPPPT